MKIRLLAAALVCGLSLPLCLPAQSGGKAPADKAPPAPKGPAELAIDVWNKARNDPAGKTQAGFPAVIAAGMDFIQQFPTHGQINTVVNQLASFANSIDAKQPALRAAYLSLLKFEATNRMFSDQATPPVKAALAGVDAAAAEMEMRVAPDRDRMAALREKIDTLAETPGAGRFLADRERAYSHILLLMNQAPRAEENLKRLTGHAEKNVANMAREELNILDLKKAPFELSFTALDAKTVDFAQLRGKVVALVFWSTTSKPSTDAFERLRTVHADYRRRGFEVVTVSYDKEEDREKLQKFIKDNRVNWPVYFDGKAAKNAFSPKLNAHNSNLPRVYLFDKTGVLHTVVLPGSNAVSATVPMNQLEPNVKRLLGVK